MRVVQHDVIVIGAGPAGAAAAYHASRGGLRVLIVDRNGFPRPKTCGDGLMPRAVAAVARMGVEGLHGHVVRGARFINTSRSLESYEDFGSAPSPGYGLMVRRSVLDDALLQRATAAGAEFMVGTVRRLILGGEGKAEGVIVDTPNGAQEARASTIVAASGAASGAFLRPRIGNGLIRVWGAAARTYLVLERHPGHDLRVYFPLLVDGCVISGYGWVFPISATMVNVGVGVIRTNRTVRIAPAKLLESFVQDRTRCEYRLTNAVASTPATIAPLALSPIAETPHGILLAGDLAGLANPFTGEGIAAALESGELAAEALLSGERDVSVRYRQLVMGHFGRNFRLMPLLRATHERSAFFLGRGCDMLLRPHRVVGAQVQRLVWDRSDRDLWWLQLRTPIVREAVVEVQRRLVQAAWHIRPMFGGLIAEMIERPDTRFGRYTAFGIAVRVAFSTDQSAAAEILERLIVLEAWRIICELHRDLLHEGRGSTPDAEWGCDTMSIVLADALNAIALQRLCRMDAAWINTLAEVACRLMRVNAEVAAGRQTPDDLGIDVHFYRTAARLGLGTKSDARIDPLLDATAQYLAGAEPGRSYFGNASPLLRNALAGWPAGLPAALLDLLTELEFVPHDRRRLAQDVEGTPVEEVASAAANH